MTQIRIERRIERMAVGHYGDYKMLGDGVCELRLAFGSGYRIYFAEQDDVVVVLLCGGDKASQWKDVDLAKRYWKELQEREL